MISKLRKAIIGTMSVLVMSCALAPQASALEFSKHVANGDTYVVTYAPRVDETGAANGFFVERHYNFALERMAERFYGEGAIQVFITPFSELDQDYIQKEIKAAACETALEQKDVGGFVALVCNGQ